MDGFHRDQAAASGSPFYRAFLASSGTGGWPSLKGWLVRGCVLAGESFFERIKNQYACMYVQFTRVL